MINLLVNKNLDLTIIKKRNLKYIIIYNKNNFIKYKIIKNFFFF